MRGAAETHGMPQNQSFSLELFADGRRKSISAMTDGDLLNAFIVGSREGPFTYDVRIEGERVSPKVH